MRLSAAGVATHDRAGAHVDVRRRHCCCGRAAGRQDRTEGQAAPSLPSARRRGARIRAVVRSRFHAASLSERIVAKPRTIAEADRHPAAQVREGDVRPSPP